LGFGCRVSGVGFGGDDLHDEGAVEGRVPVAQAARRGVAHLDGDEHLARLPRHQQPEARLYRQPILSWQQGYTPAPAAPAAPIFAAIPTASAALLAAIGEAGRGRLVAEDAEVDEDLAGVGDGDDARGGAAVAHLLLTEYLIPINDMYLLLRFAPPIRLD